MANKSFVVRYIIQAKDQFAAQAAKVAKATDRMKRSIKGAQKSLGDLSKRMRDVGAKASLFITGPILLAANSLKNAARDGEETRSKFAFIFRDMTERSESMADALAKGFGLGSAEARQLLGDTGDLLTGFGFSQEGALNLSNQVQELAVDLASFTNFSGGAKGASDALTKALLGERESLKSLGIAINEKQVKDKIALLVSQGATFSSLQQAKAQATLAIALEQSKNAIGDFARTSEGLANQERIASARIKDLKESLGKLLLPVALKITKAVGRLADFLQNLSPATKNIILAIVGIAAAVGPVMLALSAIAIALSPLGLLALAIAAAALIIIKNWDKVVALFSGFSRGISESLGPTMGRLIDKFKEAGKIIVELFGGDSDAAASLTDFANIGNLIGDIIGGTLDVIIRGISGVGEILGQVIGAIATLDFSQFDLGAINDQFIGFSADTSKIDSQIAGISAKTAEIKAEFLGPQNAAPAEITSAARVDVAVQVGLDQGLQQTNKPVVGGTGVRRADVGMVAG